MLAQKQKNKNVLWAVRPHLALTISQTVWAEGETFLREMAKTPKSNT